MSVLAALDTPGVLQMLLAETCVPIARLPHFEAPLVAVAHEAALVASHHIFLIALSGLVPDFVAFEAEFFAALKGVVGAFAAQNATQ